MEVQMSEEQIRTLAFYLWEEDGSPDGRADEYWEKARQQLGIGSKPAPTDDPASSGLGDDPNAAKTRPLAQ